MTNRTIPTQPTAEERALMNEWLERRTESIYPDLPVRPHSRRCEDCPVRDYGCGGFPCPGSASDEAAVRMLGRTIAPVPSDD